MFLTPDNRINMRIFIRYSTLLLLLVLLSGSFYQYLSEKSDRQGFPGELYDVDGKSFHLFCEGTQGPAILFESGRGGWYADWMPVWDALPRQQRRCTYDRLGNGWSSLRDNPPTSSSVARELSKLLDVAEITEPLIIVGHSLGGFYARKFVELYPGRVLALVLLDSTHEEAPKRLTYPPEDLTELQLCNAVAWTGFLRIFGVMSMVVPKSASPSTADQLITVANRTQFCSGLLNGAKGIKAELAGTTAPHTLGALPLVIVRRGKPADAYTGLVGEQKVLFEINEPIWYQMQEELANLSSRSVLLVAENSGHGVQFEQPDVVVEAIGIALDMINQNEEQ